MDDLHTTTSSGAPAVPAAASPASTPSRLDRQQLQDHRLPAVHECFYVPNFVTEEQAQTLLRAIYAAPKPKWRVLAHRRLQYWGGLPTDKGMVVEPLPDWLRNETQRIDALGAFGDEGTASANSVLINEYEAGQGIMPHEDGPLYYPTIATISLGSHTILNFYDRRDAAATTPDASPVNERAENPSPRQAKFQLLLEPNSLVIIRGDMYHMLHGIDEVAADTLNVERIVNAQACSQQLQPGQTLARGTRVSLTIRHVTKTKSLRALGLLR